jgi:tol-pal system protein YbgF
VDNSVYPEGVAPEVDKVPANNTLYELVGRVEQLQTELQRLTGKVDEQGNTIAELKKKQKTMYADFDERLQALENKGTPAATAPTPSAEPASAPPEESNKPATAPPPPAPEPPPPPAPEKAKPAAEPAPVPAKPSADLTAVPDEEKQIYQQATDKLRAGRTSEAIAELSDYLSKYPKGSYVSASYYWLGEGYRVSKKTDAALKAFNTVVDKYPKSSKVSDALLKLGYIALEQKNTDLARNYFTRVSTQYPTTKAAQTANEKLLTLK